MRKIPPPPLPRTRQITRSGPNTGWHTLCSLPSHDTHHRKLAAERAAKRVRGVKRVANRISVPQAAPDLNRLLAALTRNADVPSDAIGIEIADDVVTLTGAVPSWRAREAAERVVARGPGVRHIDNRITVSQPAT